MPRLPRLPFPRAARHRRKSRAGHASKNDGGLLADQQHNPLGEADDGSMDAPGSDGSAFHSRTRDSRRSAWLRTAYRAAFQPLRMVVTWAQISTQLGSVLHVHYPPVFTTLMRLLRPLTDVWDLFWDAECEGLSGFVERWWMKMALLLPLESL